MARLCGRPGCSEPGVVAYGMIPEDLLFWIAPLSDAPLGDPRVLCEHHADAMVVPMGWTLDDRRRNVLQLFTTRSNPVRHPPARPSVRNRRATGERPEQLQIDGTGEIERPPVAQPADDEPVDAQPAVAERVDDPAAMVDPAEWRPDFDPDDDLDGLLEVSSPLLARAFRGADRPRT